MGKNPGAARRSRPSPKKNTSACRNSGSHPEHASGDESVGEKTLKKDPPSIEHAKLYEKDGEESVDDAPMTPIRGRPEVLGDNQASIQALDHKLDKLISMHFNNQKHLACLSALVQEHDMQMKTLHQLSVTVAQLGEKMQSLESGVGLTKKIASLSAGLKVGATPAMEQGSRIRTTSSRRVSAVSNLDGPVLAAGAHASATTSQHKRDPRVIHVSGFPASSHEELKQYLGEVADVNGFLSSLRPMVKSRRLFCSTATLTFGSSEDAQAYLKAFRNAKPKFKDEQLYANIDLTRQQQRNGWFLRTCRHLCIEHSHPADELVVDYRGQCVYLRRQIQVGIAGESLVFPKSSVLSEEVRKKMTDSWLAAK